jgi:hypothetical protein
MTHQRARIVIGLTGCLVLTAALGATLWLYSKETPSTKYATRREAEVSGAFERGWLPARLPEHATSIYETHNLDTNERWLTFRAPATELQALTADLTPISLGTARGIRPRLPFRLRGSWPPELLATFWHTPRDQSMLGIYRAKPEEYCFAIEWPTTTVWAWSCQNSSSAGT